MSAQERDPQKLREQVLSSGTVSLSERIASQGVRREYAKASVAVILPKVEGHEVSLLFSRGKLKISCSCSFQTARLGPEAAQREWQDHLPCSA